jgi:hypothetical protein
MRWPPSHCSYVFFWGNRETVSVSTSQLALRHKQQSDFHCTCSTSVRQSMDVSKQPLLERLTAVLVHSALYIKPVNALWLCKFNFSVFQCGPNTEHGRYYEIYFVLLPIRTVAMAVKVMCKYWGRISGSHLNPHSHPFCFNPTSKLQSLHPSVILSLKFQLLYTLW